LAGAVWDEEVLRGGMEVALGREELRGALGTKYYIHKSF
jgi:hypothetical protein